MDSLEGERIGNSPARASTRASSAGFEYDDAALAQLAREHWEKAGTVSEPLRVEFFLTYAGIRARDMERNTENAHQRASARNSTGQRRAGISRSISDRRRRYPDGSHREACVLTRTACPDNPGRTVRRRADGQQPPLGAVRPASGCGCRVFATIRSSR